MGLFKLTVFSFALALFSTASLAGTFNVKDYGAKADGTTDDTAAFNSAFTAAAQVSGSTVFAPSGRYLIAGTITIKTTTTLKGEYFGPGRQRGTILLSTFGKGQETGPGCIVMEGGSAITNIAFEYPEQIAEAAEPIPYPYTIKGAGDTYIAQIFLYNSYQGINMDEAHAHIIREIWGEPLKVGISVDHVYDISRIENVHFWPYFTLGKPMRSWVQANGTAFEFGRSDWQHCLNIFSYGYRTGFRFFTSKEIKEKGYPAGATNGQFVGLGADCVGVAIDVEDSFNIGVSITNSLFGPFGGANTRGVLMRKGNTGNLTFVNCNFWAVTDTLFEVQDGSLNLTACNIHEWAAVNKDAPAFIINNGRLNVTGCTFNKSGYLATLAGDQTRVSFTNNMGTDEPQRIISAIGSRLLTSNNNPEMKVEKTAGSSGAKEPSGKTKKRAPKEWKPVDH